MYNNVTLNDYTMFCVYVVIVNYSSHVTWSWFNEIHGHVVSFVISCILLVHCVYQQIFIHFTVNNKMIYRVVMRI
jgi:hypothetical protein